MFQATAESTGEGQEASWMNTGGWKVEIAKKQRTKKVSDEKVKGEESEVRRTFDDPERYLEGRLVESGGSIPVV